MTPYKAILLLDCWDQMKVASSKAVWKLGFHRSVSGFEISCPIIVEIIVLHCRILSFRVAIAMDVLVILRPLPCPIAYFANSMPVMCAILGRTSDRSRCSNLDRTRQNALDVFQEVWSRASNPPEKAFQLWYFKPRCVLRSPPEID